MCKHKPDLNSVWTHSVPKAPGRICEFYLMAKCHYFIYSIIFHSLFLKSQYFYFFQSIMLCSLVGQFSPLILKVVGTTLMMLQHFFPSFCAFLCLWVNIQSPVCPSFILTPLTILCRIVFDNLVMRLGIFIIARRSSCIPIESLFLLRTS